MKSLFLRRTSVKIAAFVLFVLLSLSTVAGIACAVYRFDAVYNAEISDAGMIFDWYDGFLAKNSESLSKFERDFLSVMRSVEIFTYKNGTLLNILTALTAILSLVLFIYLIRAAGRRPYDDEITMRFLDRIPFDLYSLIFGFIIISGFFVSVRFFTYVVFDNLTVYNIIYGFLSETALMVAGLLCTYSFAILYIMSVSVRIKYHGIIGVLRSMIVWRICAFLFKWLRRFCRYTIKALRSVHMIGRFTAIYAAAAFVVTMIFFGTVSNGRYMAWGILFWLILLFALFVAVVAFAYELTILKKGGEMLARGNLDYKVPLSRLFWEFRNHAQNLNSISEGMASAVEEKIKSERFKTELITNVSHDIKTPLTSIINYADLLSREEELSDTAREYVDVLKRQSARLKKLTEDVVEMSKATAGVTTVEAADLNICELTSQCVAEYSERFEKEKLELVQTLPPDKMIIHADGRLMWRVLDNLFRNICRYAMPGTRVYISVQEGEKDVHITIRNISRDPLGISPQELMERFVRGDSARTSEGSGLGLSIARSLVELQGGEMKIDIDGDLFKVNLIFKKILEKKQV